MKQQIEGDATPASEAAAEQQRRYADEAREGSVRPGAAF
jgi:hypothetical protein